MLFTEPHNQFKAELDRKLQGAPVSLDPVYAPHYETWTEENKNALPSMDTERRTVRFSDYVEEKMFDQEKTLIDEKEKDPIQRQALYNQALRGDLLLVSTDNGQHFDEVLNLAEAQEKDLATLRIFSSSLRSSTSNLTEAKEEQNLQHITRKLREQGCVVTNASIEAHKIHLEVIHPKNGTFNVHVELNQDPLLVPVYTLENKKGKKTVTEDQLSLIFGLPADEPTALKSEEEAQGVQALSVMKQMKTQHQNTLAKKLVMNALLPQELQRMQNAEQDKEQAAKTLMASKIQRKQQETNAQQTSPFVNVMAAKHAVAEQKKRNEAGIAGEKERWEERQKKIQSRRRRCLQKITRRRKNQ